MSFSFVFFLLYCALSTNYVEDIVHTKEMIISNSVLLEIIGIIKNPLILQSID